MTVFIPIWFISLLKYFGTIITIGIALYFITFIAYAIAQGYHEALNHWADARGVKQMIKRFILENPELAKQAKRGKLK